MAIEVVRLPRRPQPVKLQAWSFWTLRGSWLIDAFMAESGPKNVQKRGIYQMFIFSTLIVLSLLGDSLIFCLKSGVHYRIGRTGSSARSTNCNHHP